MFTTLCPSHPVQLASLWTKQQPGRHTPFFSPTSPLACYDDSPKDGGRPQHCLLQYLLSVPTNFYDLPRQFSFRSFISCCPFTPFLFSPFVYFPLFSTLLFSPPTFYGLAGATLFFIFFLYFSKKNGFSIRKERGCCFAEENGWLLKRLLIFFFQTREGGVVGRWQMVVVVCNRASILEAVLKRWRRQTQKKASMIKKHITNPSGCNFEGGD